MNTFRLYGTWNEMLTQWLSDPCRTRRANLVWLIVGLALARRVTASAIVKTWPLSARVVSLTRRLSRFLDNPAVRPAVWYRPVARRVLARGQGQTLTLIMDATQVGRHQLVMVAVAYKRRALPVAWTWVKRACGHTSAQVQQVLLQRVQRLVPVGTQVVVTGDAEFGNVALVQQVTAWGWQYVLRVTGPQLVCVPGQCPWQPFRDLVQQPGQSVWWPLADFTFKWQQPTALLAYWAIGQPEPWLLMTNLTDARTTQRLYARRMWIEEMFGDWKGHGLNLHTTHLRHADRLSRLTLAICLLYVWLVTLAHRTIKAGLRPWVDRPDRRDLSRFRIGWDMLDRCCTLGLPPPIALVPLLSGS